MAIAGVATVLGHLAPIVGGPVFGILIGAVAAAVVPGLRARRWAPGYAVASRPVLQLSIVVLGTGLSLQEVLRVGGQSLPVMLGTLAIALGGAWLLGRWLGVRGDTQTLIAVGTGICGASAIAATTAVIKPKQTDVAYAIGTIFTFNIAAVLLFPPLGHLLGMDPHAFGLWAGTAINDTSSVVAASYAYGGDAGPHGIVVKLTRTLTLIPIVIVLAILVARRDATRAAAERGELVAGFRLRAMPWRKVVPLFLLGFIAAAALGSLGVIPSAWHPALSALGAFLITTALAGIGLALRLGDLRHAGYRPLLLGGLLWISVAAGSLGLQALTGTL
nr:Putative membrane protein YeiH [Kibdelosporangium sp. MJ126-NF4]CTQ98882.1 Putative membrane protein YeiH [Kibdelosporangium sp. MJ126-NF4]